MTEDNNKELESKQENTPKQVHKDISIEEMFTSGIGEKESTSAYRTQVAKNSLFQLRTILKNIDEEKFPERVKIIKETIEAKENNLDPLAKEKKEEQERINQEKEQAEKEQKAKDAEEKRKNAKTNDEKTRTTFKMIIFIILISFYVMLCNFADLPGKNYITMLLK